MSTIEREENRELIATALTEIQEMAQQVEQLLEDFPTNQEPKLQTSSSTYWKLFICMSTLTKVKLFITQNFRFIEPMATLTIARHISELTILLKLIQKNEEYALLYYHETIQARLRDLINQHQKLLQEIDFLRKTESKQNEIFSENRPDPESFDLELIFQQFDKELDIFDKRVDKEISRMLSFNIDIKKVRYYGYGFLAYMIENQLLERYEWSIAKQREELSTFQQTIAKNLKLPVPEQWDWKDLARQVDMGNEYEFIHSYAENILHVTPISLLTNQQNLEVSEIKSLIRYISTRLSDIIQIAKELIQLGNLNPTEA